MNAWSGHGQTLALLAMCLATFCASVFAVFHGQLTISWVLFVVGVALGFAASVRCVAIEHAKKKQGST